MEEGIMDGPKPEKPASYTLKGWGLSLVIIFIFVAAIGFIIIAWASAKDENETDPEKIKERRYWGCVGLTLCIGGCIGAGISCNQFKIPSSAEKASSADG